MNTKDLIFYVGPEEAGCTVGTLLRRGKGFSRTLLRKIKRGGEVLLNGSRVYMSDRVEAGDVLAVRLPPEVRETPVEPEELDLEIIYEAGGVLAVNKPAGMLVHPVRCERRGTLANGIMHLWRERGVEALFRPVYRLDRDTSGVVLVAGGHYEAQQLARQLARGDLRRRYLAVVQGLPPSGGTVNLPLAPKPGHGGEWTVDSGGKQAVTHFRLVKKLNGAALLALELETGRTHQIRVHMSHIGHPLVGDTRYGGSDVLLGRQALHAFAVDFYHPRTGVQVRLRCPMPGDMRELVRRLAI